MPELPEVERARRLVADVAVGRTITRCRCADDEIVYDGVSPRTFARRLKGRRVIAARRRGKQMWLELDRPPHPLFHLGMTGHFLSPGHDGIVYETGAKMPDDAWPPRFWKIHVELDDGGEFVMTNPRRLGRIRLRDEPEAEPPISKLGFDALDEVPPLPEFRQMLEGRRGNVKGLLMGQGFAAGVGNWIADEVLYQARIDPRRPVSSLTPDETKALRQKLIAVVRKACDVNADKAAFPRTWLFHHRWGKNADALTHDGREIDHITLGGRTTAWVPAVQR
jgi:formamidopyrimidine-DNA glycosylase